MSGLALPGDPTQDFNFLTQDERQQMRRFLMFPEEFPKEFKDWILQYVGVNAELQQSQITGLLQAVPNYEQNANGLDVTFTTTFIDDSPPSPKIEGLARGRYLVYYGANVQNQEAGVTGHITISVNGATSTTATSPYASTVFTSSLNLYVPISRVILIDLTEPSNSLTMQYARTSGGATGVGFTRRWIIAQRVGNL